jgi:hypothetical protein
MMEATEASIENNANVLFFNMVKNVQIRDDLGIVYIL